MGFVQDAVYVSGHRSGLFFGIGVDPFIIIIIIIIIYFLLLYNVHS